MDHPSLNTGAQKMIVEVSLQNLTEKRKLEITGTRLNNCDKKNLDNGTRLTPAVGELTGDKTFSAAITVKDTGTGREYTVTISVNTENTSQPVTAQVPSADEFITVSQDIDRYVGTPSPRYGVVFEFMDR